MFSIYCYSTGTLSRDWTWHIGWLKTRVYFLSILKSFHLTLILILRIDLEEFPLPVHYSNSWMSCPPFFPCFLFFFIYHQLVIFFLREKLLNCVLSSLCCGCLFFVCGVKGGWGLGGAGFVVGFFCAKNTLSILFHCYRPIISNFLWCISMRIY